MIKLLRRYKSEHKKLNSWQVTQTRS